MDFMVLRTGNRFYVINFNHHRIKGATMRYNSFSPCFVVEIVFIFSALCGVSVFSDEPIRIFSGNAGNVNGTKEAGRKKPISDAGTRGKKPKLHRRAIMKKYFSICLFALLMGIFFSLPVLAQAAPDLSGVDTNGNGYIDDEELLIVIQYWAQHRPVPKPTPTPTALITPCPTCWPTYTPTCTLTFTPTPTATPTPFTLSEWTADSYTKLLLHFDGPDGSTVMQDSSGTNKVISAHGNAHIDASQHKFGSSSVYFDGDGDFLSIPDNDDWNFGSGDFTIDFCLKKYSVDAGGAIFG